MYCGYLRYEVTCLQHLLVIVDRKVVWDEIILYNSLAERLHYHSDSPITWIPNQHDDMDVMWAGRESLGFTCRNMDYTTR